MTRVVLAIAVVMLLSVPARADFATGYAFFERGDFEGAISELTPLAKQGDSRAQYVVGVIYLNLFVDPPTPDAALTWLKSSAEQGYLQAQTELARMYRTGDGVTQDFAEAAKWYRLAAEQGDVGAQLFLADTYAYGYGVEPDLVEAYMWYEIAIQYWGALAVRAREVVAEEMTPEQIAEAVKRAAEWTKEHPQ